MDEKTRFERSAIKTWPVAESMPKMPSAFPPMMLALRPAPSLSSGSTRPGATASGAPTLARFVAFSYTSSIGIARFAPGCGPKTELKTGGSLRLFSATVTLASEDRP